VIRLTGTLRCTTPQDAALVTRLLPDHLRLTLAEPGCLAFTVTPLPEGQGWTVAECFADRQAFTAHQARAASSAWGRETAHIPREYRITDGDDAP
jgi:quinol monooxygenase YgiN